MAGRAELTGGHMTPSGRGGRCWSWGPTPLPGRPVGRSPGPGLPWWSRGRDSALPVRGVWVQALVRELDLACRN